MKVVILAGGLGTRLSEYTKLIPKPMVRVGGKPIIYRIINLYKKYGYKEFYIALGYKGSIIKKFFNKRFKGIKVNLINTGKNTMTGGRLKRLKNYLNSETFLMTYGDGLSDVNINKLVNFHKKNKSLATITAVRPPARFGSIKIKKNDVYYFKEKSSVDEGWINGGFFVFEPEIFKYIKNDSTYLEREPFEKLAKKKKIKAYKHQGFWQCMDTKRDKILLDKIIKEKRYNI
tara:strand:+ start:318 stop:1010 length:693 start_codon:yes stop_codon:yes gene_type:complete